MKTLKILSGGWQEPLKNNWFRSRIWCLRVAKANITSLCLSHLEWVDENVTRRRLLDRHGLKIRLKKRKRKRKSIAKWIFMQTKFPSPHRSPSSSRFLNRKKNEEKKIKKLQWPELRLRKPHFRSTNATCRENVRDWTLQTTSMSSCLLNSEPELSHGAFLFLASKWWWRKRHTIESLELDKRLKKALRLPSFLLECKNTRMREKDELLKT